ncbi:MAG: DUF4382 domain-containing protein [Lewinella sp.]|nr:DUF4382 domain-containing protein [Lewinella sp.]
MKTIHAFFVPFCLMLSLAFVFTSCNDDPDGDATGAVNVALTDGPLDDARVEGVFVTVTGVEVNGSPLADFSGKQTIELSALTQGSTRMLGSDNLTAGAYSDVRLLLDTEMDATGNAPGCYVLTDDGTRHPLKINGTASGMAQVNTGSFMVNADQTTNVVIDFDLRKALQYESSGDMSDAYEFVAQTDLNAALRLVNEEETGTIRGQADRNSIVDGNARIVAYAYASGTYNESSETQAQGSGQIMFANAVTSCAVNSAGEYMLSFLPAGEYDVVFAAYKDNNSDGESEFVGTLNVGLLGNLGISPGSVTVESSLSVNLNIGILGIQP